MSKIILVVDDELDIVKVIRKRLVEHGFNVIVAADAYQATKIAYKEKPDLVVLDLMLPAGGGLGVLKNIRASAELGQTPIIVLTGMRDEEYKEQALEQGVEAYLEKPYDPDKLIETIDKLLLK